MFLLNVTHTYITIAFHEQKDALILLPTSGADMVDSSKGGATLDHQTMVSSFGTNFGQRQTQGGGMYQNNMQGFMTTNTLSSGQYSTGMYGNSFKKYPTMPTVDGFKENRIQLDTVSGAGDFVAFNKRSNRRR